MFYKLIKESFDDNLFLKVEETFGSNVSKRMTWCEFVQIFIYWLFLVFIILNFNERYDVIILKFHRIMRRDQYLEFLHCWRLNLRFRKHCRSKLFPSEPSGSVQWSHDRSLRGISQRESRERRRDNRRWDHKKFHRRPLPDWMTRYQTMRGWLRWPSKSSSAWRGHDHAEVEKYVSEELDIG